MSNISVGAPEWDTATAVAWDLIRRCDKCPIAVGPEVDVVAAVYLARVVRELIAHISDAPVTDDLLEYVGRHVLAGQHRDNQRNLRLVTSQDVTSDALRPA